MIREKLQGVERKKNAVTAVYLIVSIVCIVFSYDVYVFALCAWIWPALLIWFCRSNRIKIALPITYAVLLIGMGLSWWRAGEYIMGSPVVEFIALLILALPAFIVFAADRLLYNKLSDIQCLLLFPCLWVTLDILQTLTPVGIITTLAYSQRDFLPIVQSLSVFGTHGLTFIICLFATSVNLFVKKITENERKILQLKSSLQHPIFKKIDKAIAL